MEQQRELARALGVPEGWLPDVSVNGAASLRDAIFGVGGQYAQRTLEELEQAVDLGLGVELQLPPRFDLRGLDRIVRRVRRLSIGTPPEGLTGWAVLESALELESLRVGLPTEPMGLEQLPKLSSFAGGGDYSVFAAANPNLRRLELDRAKWPVGLDIAGPLAYLQLEGVRGFSALPRLGAPLAIETIRIHDIAQFDASWLREAQNLTWIQLSRVRKLTNVGDLSSLGSLSELELTDIRLMPDWRDLANIVAPNRITISGNYSVPDDFASELTRGSTKWQIAPKKPTDDERALANFHFDANNVDSDTFSPFVIVNDGGEQTGYFLILNTFQTTGQPLNCGDATAVIASDIGRLNSTSLTSGAIDLDATNDQLRATFTSARELLSVARRLAGLWRDTTNLEIRARFGSL